MINRELYMEQITPFIDKPFVKVITGIRRCGKSVVLRLISEELLRRGVSEDYIIYMNFESFEWIDMKEATALYVIFMKLRKPRENIIFSWMRFRKLQIGKRQ